MYGAAVSVNFKDLAAKMETRSRSRDRGLCATGTTATREFDDLAFTRSLRARLPDCGHCGLRHALVRRAPEWVSYAEGIVLEKDGARINQVAGDSSSLCTGHGSRPAGREGARFEGDDGSLDLEGDSSKARISA